MPAKELTSIIKVDSGRWKFVIRLSITFHLYPGYINIFVHPDLAFTIPFSSATDYIVLVLVVPTLITLCPLALALFIFSAASSVTI